MVRIQLKIQHSFERLQNSAEQAHNAKASNPNPNPNPMGYGLLIKERIGQVVNNLTQ